ncbi:hypothetical protein GOP47_0018484 [Adiantum capillus-veneris]|uniref:Uncharacterized protein n=1 Tax=Adiantum capillus-veneris TaxID=13818 RepID=A0A9D4Z9L9_ADICA|nr:hypothetical protein GOP47_0018484 [Adiantum capillus-veneris]
MESCTHILADKESLVSMSIANEGKHEEQERNKEPRGPFFSKNQGSLVYMAASECPLLNALNIVPPLDKGKQPMVEEELGGHVALSGSSMVSWLQFVSLIMQRRIPLFLAHQVSPAISGVEEMASELEGAQHESIDVP